MTEQNSILVLDDDPDVREMLTDYFTAQGYEVIALGTGEAMREALGERVPDVVLLDVGLPGEDGLSLARYVREHFDVGIIMVSGAGDTLDRIIGLEVGADDYVAKPFDLRELHARVKSVIRRYVRSAATAQSGSVEPPAAASRVPTATSSGVTDPCSVGQMWSSSHSRSACGATRSISRATRVP